MIDIERERELLRERALGKGLEFDLISPGLDLTRDIRLFDGPGGRDLALVSGFANLTQALSVALTTRLGDDVFNTTYGFDGLNAIAEETNPIMQRERIRISIIVVLRKEPRVRRIVDVAFVDSRLDEVGANAVDSAVDKLEKKTATDRELHVRVAFEAISGDQVAIDLGTVIANG
jgi:hypothetical protein